ncbi:MAG: ClpX C4-type zinc finger protein [Rhodoplanes sp.]
MTRIGTWLRAVPPAIRRPRRLRCSFCRRPAAEVGRLVAGASAYICDTCIVKCVAVRGAWRVETARFQPLTRRNQCATRLTLI